MYTEINVPFVKRECPKGKTEKNCEARNYMKNEKELFVETANENVFDLKQNYLDARIKYEWAFAHLAKCCEKCCGRNK